MDAGLRKELEELIVEVARYSSTWVRASAILERLSQIPDPIPTQNHDLMEREIRRLRVELEAVKNRFADLVVLLEAIQWGGSDSSCPSCDGPKSSGHERDCELIKIMREGARDV